MDECQTKMKQSEKYSNILSTTAMTKDRRRLVQSSQSAFSIYEPSSDNKEVNCRQVLFETNDAIQEQEQEQKKEQQQVKEEQKQEQPPSSVMMGHDNKNNSSSSSPSKETPVVLSFLPASMSLLHERSTVLPSFYKKGQEKQPQDSVSSFLQLLLGNENDLEVQQSSLAIVDTHQELSATSIYHNIQDAVTAGTTDFYYCDKTNKSRTKTNNNHFFDPDEINKIFSFKDDDEATITSMLSSHHHHHKQPYKNSRCNNATSSSVVFRC